MTEATVHLTASGHLAFHIPGPDRGHHVVVPPDERGMAIITRVLREREQNPQRGIGTDASPTQAMVDAYLKAHGPAKVKSKFSDIDLDLGDL